MKTTQECWQALIDGEKLRNVSGLESGVVELNNGMLNDSKGNSVTYLFDFPEEWFIYTPTKWYDNIPDGGVLCWISDISENPENGNTMKVIVDTENGFFIGATKTTWRYATPLTKQEIQTFLDNAPEGEHK